MLATLTGGSQISATQEEFMGHNPAPSTEHVATESTETEEEEFVLPRLRVRFQDEILSEVGLMCLLNMFELINFKTPKKIHNIFNIEVIIFCST